MIYFKKIENMCRVSHIRIRAAGECFHTFFTFSQTFMSVSIKQLDYEFEISIAIVDEGVA